MNVSPVQGYPQLFDKASSNLDNINPLILILLTIIIIFYYTIFSSFSKASVAVASSGKQMAEMKYIEIFLWGLFLFLLFINGLQYFFDLNINTTIKNIFTGKPKFTISVKDRKKKPLLSYQEEVFHLADNVYNFEDAKAACKAHNSRLATYDEVQKSYDKGGEWCSYGWSDNQLALFPTQKATYDKLQKIKGHEHDCGRPGINGGFVANKNSKFGVNCYGFKPKMKPIDHSSATGGLKYPKTAAEKAFNQKVGEFRKNKNNLAITSFNSAKWNQV